RARIMSVCSMVPPLETEFVPAPESRLERVYTPLRGGVGAAGKEDVEARRRRRVGWALPPRASAARLRGGATPRRGGGLPPATAPGGDRAVRVLNPAGRRASGSLDACRGSGPRDALARCG